MSALLSLELDAVIMARHGVVAAAVRLWGGEGSEATVIAAVQLLADAEAAEAEAHRRRAAEAAAEVAARWRVPAIPPPPIALERRR